VIDENRQHPRFRLPLRVVVKLPGGDVTTTSTGVSRAGLSVRLSPPPPVDTVIPITIELPDGARVDGEACTRGVLPGDLVGMSLTFDEATRARWDAFVDY
jgi:hypothetical protein